VSSTNYRFSHCFASAGKKTKKGRETREKSAPCQHSKIGGKMKRKKRKRKQQGCDVAKVIETVEQAVSTAKKGFIGLSSQL
jgi:hypothetical protein